MLFRRAIRADLHLICAIPSHNGRVDNTPFLQVTSFSPLKVNPLLQVTVYLLPEAIVVDVGVTVPSEIVGLLQELAKKTFLLRNSYSQCDAKSIP